MTQAQHKPPASVGPPTKKISTIYDKATESFQDTATSIDEVAKHSREIEAMRAEQAQNVEELLGKLIALRASPDTPTPATSGPAKEPVVTANLIAAVVLAALGTGGVALTVDQTDAITQLVAGAFVLAPLVVNGVAAAVARSRVTWVPKK